MGGLFRFRVGPAPEDPPPPPPPPTNQPPVWDVVPTLTVAYNTTTASITPYVIDPESQPMTFTKAGNWPTYLTLNGTSGAISATVSTPVGTYTDLQVVAADPQAATATSATFSVTVIKGQNRPPVWAASIPTQNLSIGAGFFVGGYVSDIDADPIVFTAVTMPAGFSLNTNTGFVSCDSAASGTYSIRIGASDGSVTVNSPLIAVTVAAAQTGSLSIMFQNAYTLDTVFDRGILWNKWAVDKRGGVIGFNDGDHSPTNIGSNDVRYYNYAGAQPYVSRHGSIGVGQQGLLQLGYVDDPNSANSMKNPLDTSPYCLEEDNYPIWYSPAEDKWFWLYGGGTGTNGRYGIFDMRPYDSNNNTGARWVYGNATNIGTYPTDWPTGPYWGDYVECLTTNTVGMNKNSPNDWCEATDMGFAVNHGDSAMVIDRNYGSVNYPTKPYKLRLALVRDYQYSVKVQSSTRNTYGGDTVQEWCQTTVAGAAFPGENRWGSGHNQFMVSGVCAGGWFYFIRPATGGPNAFPHDTYINGERNNYPDLVVDGVTYKGYKTREFWRVLMVPPFNRYDKLAQFPEFEIIPVAGATNNPNWGAALYYDQTGNKIYAVHKELWEYSIKEDRWRNKTSIVKDPTGQPGYKRWLNSVGGIFKMPSGDRHIVFRSRANVGSVTAAQEQSWHRIELKDGSEPPATWVDAELDKIYAGRSNKDIPLGKHRRHIWSPYFRAKTSLTSNADQLYYGDVASSNSATIGVGQAQAFGSYVWAFGGDYGDAIPRENAVGYPSSSQWGNDSGRQDQYRVNVKPVNGKLIMELAINHVAFYPYPGGPSTDPLVTQFGPVHPDGVGITFDKRGYGWLGPGYFRFPIVTTPPSVGSGEPKMYKVRLPMLDAATNTRRGDAYEVPPQTALRVSSRTPVAVVTVGGTENALTFDTGDTSQPVEGRMYTFTPTANNSGGVTISVNGSAAKPLHKFQSMALAAGDLVAGTSYSITYDAFKFILHEASPLTMNKLAFGTVNMWTAYDPHEDCVVFATGGGRNGSVTLWKFNCLPDAQGIHRWTRTVISYNVTTWWQPKANLLTRNGVAADSNLQMNGAQVIIKDNLYFVVLNGGTGYADRNVAYMFRLNLRDTTDMEIIPFPVAWSTDYDDPVSLVNANTTDHSQLRDIQALGHLVVLGPPGNEYKQDTDPWCSWYDTNRKVWTRGKTYTQMRSESPELPSSAVSPLTVYSGDPANPYLETSPVRQHPRMSRGMMCCVLEDGSMWYVTAGDPVSGSNTRKGIVKYRIL